MATKITANTSARYPLPGWTSTGRVPMVSHSGSHRRYDMEYTGRQRVDRLRPSRAPQVTPLARNK
jgi:hypothetical protein